MTDRDCWTLDAMKRFGGSFVQALSEVAQRADDTNLSLIKSTWPKYWAQYEEMGIIQEKKENGL